MLGMDIFLRQSLKILKTTLSILSPFHSSLVLDDISVVEFINAIAMEWNL